MSGCQCLGHQFLHALGAPTETRIGPPVITLPSDFDIADFVSAIARLGGAMPDVEPEPTVPDVDDEDDEGDEGDEDGQPFATVSITISGTPFLVAQALDRLSLP